MTKRREYAQAGIPAYLIVDLRSGRGELTLYTRRDSEFHYLDAAPRRRVTINLNGTLIPIAVTDLLP